MQQTTHENRSTKQRGAILILMALMIVPLTVMTAIVVDLGMVRWQKATMQNAVDSAAVAAGNKLSAKGSGSPNGDGLPQVACTSALASLRQNLSSFLSTDVDTAGGCAGNLPALVSACVATYTASPSQSPTVLTATSGNYTATITYPVPLSASAAAQNEALATGRVAYVGNNVTTVDPTSAQARCRVMGVRVKQSNMSAYFGGAIGVTSQSATAQADGATPATSTTTSTTTTTLPCNPTQNDTMTPSLFTRNPSSGAGVQGTTLTATLPSQVPGCSSGITAMWRVGNTWSYYPNPPDSNLTVVNPPAVQLSNVQNYMDKKLPRKSGWIEATLTFKDPVTGQPVSVTNLNFTIGNIQNDEQSPIGSETAYRRTRVWLSDANDLDHYTAGSVLPFYTQPPGGDAAGNGSGNFPWTYKSWSGSGTSSVNVNFAGPVSLVKVHFDIVGIYDRKPLEWPSGIEAKINISNMTFTH